MTRSALLSGNHRLLTRSLYIAARWHAVSPRRPAHRKLRHQVHTEPDPMTMGKTCAGSRMWRFLAGLRLQLIDKVLPEIRSLLGIFKFGACRRRSTMAQLMYLLVNVAHASMEAPTITAIDSLVLHYTEPGPSKSQLEARECDSRKSFFTTAKLAAARQSTISPPPQARLYRRSKTALQRITSGRRGLDSRFKDIKAPAASSNMDTGLPAFLTKGERARAESFLDLEWAQNQRYLEGRQQPHNPTNTNKSSRWARLTGTEVAKRNRYANIDPFHSNRVKLRAREGVCDYINASPIILRSDADKQERRYIACQGPTVASASHMWRMIAQHTADPAVVVMLTQTHEGHREKCWPYFPTDPALPIHLPIAGAKAVSSARGMAEEEDFRGTVTLISSVYDDLTHSTIRTLQLRTVESSMDANNSTGVLEQSKTVIHYLFERWPDFGVPEGEDRAALLDLIRVTEQASKQDTAKNGTQIMNNPRIIHCSAGVGRSGTFIALDYLLAEMESGILAEIDDSRDRIAETVDQLRQQRMMMVQGEKQFDYLYTTLKEEWLKREQRNGNGDQGGGGPQRL
ncbi:hypothetical protein FH972_025488 [Carpinus fangiana]|uniref:Tyrosine specific protein phosphatases domain-containing protein n=1 Tax=Carpinus fangiana TaxID=176857 RepID=A0A5N6L1F1_9ROSI|nr:hypothetical protein FH972_025488 [Carpinus fangiana]